MINATDNFGFAAQLRVGVVAGILMKFDAISGAVRDTIRAVSSVPHWKVSVFTAYNEFNDLPVHLVHSAEALSSHWAFRAADVVIYHFGFSHDLFEVMKDGNGHAHQIVFFHNITPERHAAHGMHAEIRRSFEQFTHLHHADWFWPVSRTNASLLIDTGIDPTRIEIVPPVIEWPAAFELGTKKRSPPIQVLFVGRITQSKGVLDLVRAVQLVRSRCSAPFSVSIVGNLRSDEQAYYAAIKDEIGECGLDPVVEILGRIQSDHLEALYRNAHILAIPSYHEGFCRPVAEGLRAGCVPVGYSGYNLPLVANGLGRLVPPGDIGALADALAIMIETIARAEPDPSAAILPLDRGPLTIREFDAAAAAHVNQFSFETLSRSVIGRIISLSGAPVPLRKRS